KQQAGERVPLGDSGLEVELVRNLESGDLGQEHGGALKLVPAGQQGLTPDPAVELRIHGGKSPGRLILFSRSSTLAIQDYRNQVFGAYWYDFGELTAEQRMSGAAGARIDVLHGENKKLYYRNWNG